MSNLKYEFDCGCKIKQFGTELKECDGLPSMEIDYYNLPDCPLMWDMLCEGNSKGVFQLETKVGKDISKKLQPRNIEELSALVALMRPGSANAIVDGKSMTNHYIDRKNGSEEVKSIHPQLEDILSDTFQVLIYQEQCIAIAVKLAGFDAKEADTLRKSMGTKDAELMAEVRVKFIVGCKKTGLVTEEEANYIFDMVQASNRYSFNKCLSPKTVVETEKGFETLENVKVGDKILAPKNDNSGDEFVEIIAKYDNGNKELYEITLQSGKTIECTLDHKFLCDNGLVLSLSKILIEGYSIMCEID